MPHPLFVCHVCAYNCPRPIQPQETRNASLLMKLAVNYSSLTSEILRVSIRSVVQSMRNRSHNVGGYQEKLIENLGGFNPLLNDGFAIGVIFPLAGFT